MSVTMTNEIPASELVGPDEVAELLGVQRHTIVVWRHRQIMPTPAVVLSGVPLWDRQDVEKWAHETGRLE